MILVTMILSISTQKQYNSFGINTCLRLRDSEGDKFFVQEEFQLCLECTNADASFA